MWILNKFSFCKYNSSICDFLQVFRVFSTCSFIENKTQNSLWILRNFSSCNFNKNETPRQAFPSKFYKTFKSVLAEHLWGAISNNMTIATFFCKIYCSLKCKTKGYKRELLLKNNYVFLIFLVSLKTTIILITTTIMTYLSISLFVLKTLIF